MAVIWACTAFGAICGSSVATTATFGRAALPELQRYKYDGGFATGTIAVGGTLGILIPPSIILVVYAITTEQNIAKLFKAALIPGLMAALFYTLAIAWTVRRRPELAPPAAMTAADRGKALLSVWPALLVALTVVGGIYGGMFTPTEGAAVGAIAMLLVGLAQRSLSWSGILESLRQTAETSAMIFIILLGSEVFDAFLALSKLPEVAAELVGKSALPPYAIMIALMLFYILLGAVMDELAMILLTLPVFFPDRAGARLRHARRRGGDLVRHPRADCRRYRPDRAADRPKRVRHQLDRQDRSHRLHLPRRAALHFHGRGPARAGDRFSGSRALARAAAKLSARHFSQYRKHGAERWPRRATGSRT